MRSTLAVLLAALVVGIPAPAQNLTSDQVMRIHFKVNLPFNTQPNTLKLNFGLITVNQSYGTRRAVLYDCDKRLGEHASSLFGSHVGALNLDPSNSWTAQGSPWTFDGAAIVDFTPVQNGTIVGIVDFTIDRGAVTIPLAQVNLNMIRATGASGGNVVSPNPTITEIAIVPKLVGPTPGTVGTTNTWAVSGASPSSFVFLGFGTICGPIPVLGVTYDIGNPLVFIAVPTNTTGMGSLNVFVPPFAVGQKLLVQGIEIVGSTLVVTNFSAHTF